MQEFMLNRDRQPMAHVNYENLSVPDLPDQKQQQDDRLLQRTILKFSFVAPSGPGVHRPRHDDARRRIEHGLVVANPEVLDSAEPEVVKQIDELLFRFTKVGFLY